MEEEKKINVHQIFWYFVLFSMLGLAIETLYARVTMGILPNKWSSLYMHNNIIKQGGQEKLF